jgi:type III restriction enzyme
LGAGVNNLGKFGRWAFAEFTAVYEIETEFRKLIDALSTGTKLWKSVS